MNTMKHVTAFLLLAVSTTLLAPAAFTQEAAIYREKAVASFYGDAFQGKPTSSGELFDMNALTAAHKNLPFGTVLRVTNLANGKSVDVRVNDRGPFVEGREIDVSKEAAKRLDMIETGVATVSIAIVTPVTDDKVNTVIVETAAPAKETPKAPIRESMNDTVQTPTWRIQLGSFVREENATRLVYQLRDKGFDPAFERTGTSIRVVIDGIAETDLQTFRKRLTDAGWRDYLVRQESW